jgi:hypothetical protein
VTPNKASDGPTARRISFLPALLALTAKPETRPWSPPPPMFPRVEKLSNRSVGPTPRTSVCEGWGSVVGVENRHW